MRVIASEELLKYNDPVQHIRALQKAFADGQCQVPARQIYNTSDSGSRLLIMPAWGYQGYAGVKLITTTPSNHGTDLPFIQGSYLLMDMATGTPVAQIDAPTLTNLRTAAASGLAADYLAHPESKTLLMVGAGSMAPYLIAAHSAVRPIDRVLIWSRGFRSAERLAEQMDNALSVKNLKTAVEQADIISCATPSTMPLVRGDWLRGGQHIDLVGGYTPEMRETDDGVMQRADIFVDTDDAWHEAGDLIQPMNNGVISKESTLADLSKLCRGEHAGRSSHKQITLFKSVGHALEDIALAVWVYEKMLS